MVGQSSDDRMQEIYWKVLFVIEKCFKKSIHVLYKSFETL